MRKCGLSKQNIWIVVLVWSLPSAFFLLAFTINTSVMASQSVSVSNYLSFIKPARCFLLNL